MEDTELYSNTHYKLPMKMISMYSVFWKHRGKQLILPRLKRGLQGRSTPDKPCRIFPRGGEKTANAKAEKLEIVAHRGNSKPLL